MDIAFLLFYIAILLQTPNLRSRNMLPIPIYTICKSYILAMKLYYQESVTCSELLASGIPKTLFPTFQAVSITVGFSPEIDTKTLLLNVSHTSVMKHGEIKLIFTWTYHPYWWALTALEGAIHNAGGEK